MYSASKIIQNLWNDLSERQREVLAGRFGLDKGGKPQTLAALGAKYRVTRERIRQIEASGLSALRSRINENNDIADILDRARKFLKEQGGVAREDALLKHIASFTDGMTRNHLAVLIEAAKSFFQYADDKDNYAFYYLDKAALKTALTFIDQWAGYLKTRKAHALEGRYRELLSEFLKKKSHRPNHVENFLAITKKVHVSPYGDTGLAEWPEIRPKTIRDRVYLVLKKKKAPLHFRDIAKTINDISSTKSAASAPTVHNELIKDERFVLVGRGMYALAEFGYEPGTAREVISKVLKKHGSLKPKDVITQVQKARFFKPNTVLVNLQNKAYFERRGDGTYRVREA